MPPVHKINLYRPITLQKTPPMHKTNHYRTTSVLKMHPVQKFKHYKTIFAREDVPHAKSNIPGPPLQVQKTPMLKCEHFKTHSSRTLACIMLKDTTVSGQNMQVQGHMNIISKDTTVQDISTSSRTSEYIISMFTFHNAYITPMCYTLQQPEKLGWLPQQTMEDAPAGDYFI